MTSINVFAGRVLSLHRRLHDHAFYPLTLCTFISLALLAGRFHFVGNRGYAFLVWNLFLEWIPYWITFAMAALPRDVPMRRAKLLAMGLIWLLFLPNAPYILTDFVHLHRGTNFTWWYDLGLIAAFAWTGCFLGVISINIMHQLVRPSLGWLGSWLLVLAVMGLSGFGIYLGRFERWNSWDVLRNPGAIAMDIIDRVINPMSHPRTYGVTIMFASILFAFYITFNWIRALPAAEEVKEYQRKEVSGAR